MADRRSNRRANAGRPDKPAPSYGAPLSTPRPTNVKRPTPGPADTATRRRAIERRVQEGKAASKKARSKKVVKSTAPKPEPDTIGKPGRSTYDVLRDRGKDTDEAVERTEK